MSRPPSSRATDPPDFISRSSETFAAIAGWSFDHRWWVLLLSVLMLAGSLVLASGALVDSSYEAYFDPRDPAYEREATERDEVVDRGQP